MANYNVATAPIGADISNYYQAALSNDPRMAGINRNLSGQVAPDVKRQMAQAAAERGIGIGSYGAGNDQSAYLRALGLTSMGLTNQGIGQYSEAYNSVPKLSPSDLFVSSSTQAGLEQQRALAAQDEKLKRDLLSQELASKSQLQRDALTAEANRQSLSLSSNERMQANALGQDAAQFNANRTDTASGAAATNAKLQGMLNRLSGGSATGGSSGTSYSSGGSPQAGSQSGYNWANPGAAQSGGLQNYGGLQGDYFDTGGGNSSISYSNQPTEYYGTNSDPFSTGDWGMDSGYSNYVNTPYSPDEPEYYF